jgi:hypothetical protein
MSIVMFLVMFHHLLGIIDMWYISTKEHMHKKHAISNLVNLDQLNYIKKQMMGDIHLQLGGGSTITKCLH